jgi:hypothetical protein
MNMYGGQAQRRAAEQFWMIGRRHRGMLYAVAGAQSWAAAAATSTRQRANQLTMWHEALGQDETPGQQAMPVSPDCSGQLGDVHQAMTDVGAQSALAMLFDTDPDPSPEKLKAVFVAWFGEPWKKTTEVVSKLNAQIIPKTLQCRQQAWVAEVAEALRIFSAAGLCSEWVLREYAIAMNNLIDKATRLVQYAYRQAAAVAHEPQLQATLSDEGRALEPADAVDEARALTTVDLWLRDLRAAGISADQCRAVLADLESRYGEPVARLRRQLAAS